MTAPRVFVSHSHLDERFTKALVQGLQRAGADIFVDIVDITANDFMQRINEALLSCDWMVVVLTPSAIQSSAVTMEVNAALNRVRLGLMKGVIPVIAADIEMAKIPPLWSTLHFYDARRGLWRAQRGLLTALGLTPVRQPVSSAPKPSALAPTNVPPLNRRVTWLLLLLGAVGVAMLVTSVVIVISSEECSPGATTNAQCGIPDLAHSISTVLAYFAELFMLVSWIIGIWHTVQRRQWGWLAAVFLLPGFGSFLYGLTHVRYA